MGRDSPTTLRDCFPHTLRSISYNTSQTSQNLRSTKVIPGNITSSGRKEFLTIFNSRVFTSCSTLPITADADQRSAILRWPRDGHKKCSSDMSTSRCSVSNLACQVRSNSSDHQQISTRTASDGHASRNEAHAWQGVQKSYPRHQQNLSPKLPIRRKDHIYVNLLESTIEKGVGCPISLCFYKSTEDGQAASFLSEEIAYYLERRVPFRRIKQLLLRELRTDYIEGVRVNCSGRVGGRSKKAQRARGERFQWGQTS